MATGLNMSVNVCLSLCVIPAPRLYDASRRSWDRVRLASATLIRISRDFFMTLNIILKSVLNKYFDCTVCALLSCLSRIITYT